jgi:GNAT superfamily N-acetyltransferase
MTGNTGTPPVATAEIAIRRAETPADWRAIRDLCCRTGAEGGPIEVTRWPFFAQLRIGPYERHCPEWTYAAVRGDRVAVHGGRVAGYLTGCPDTRALRQRSRASFTLPLLLAVLTRRYAWNRDTRLFVMEALRLDVRSRLDRAPLGYGRVLAACPAHLHMNVDAADRAAGIGRALMHRYLADLRAHGVPGVHLMCGDRPLGFYARLGFRTIGTWRGRAGDRRHLLAQEFAPASSLTAPG